MRGSVHVGTIVDEVGVELLDVNRPWLLRGRVDGVVNVRETVLWQLSRSPWWTQPVALLAEDRRVLLLVLDRVVVLLEFDFQVFSVQDEEPKALKVGVLQQKGVVHLDEGVVVIVEARALRFDVRIFVHLEIC